MFEWPDVVAEFYEDVAGDFDASAGAAVEVDDFVFGDEFFEAGAELGAFRFGSQVA